MKVVRFKTKAAGMFRGGEEITKPLDNVLWMDVQMIDGMIGIAIHFLNSGESASYWYFTERIKIEDQ